MIKVNNSMGMLGALFIMTIASSLFLHISNYSDMKDFINDFLQGLQRCADHIKKWYEAGKNSLLNDEIFLAEHNKMNCAEIKPHLKKPEGLEMEDIDL